MKEVCADKPGGVLGAVDGCPATLRSTGCGSSLIMGFQTVSQESWCLERCWSRLGAPELQAHPNSHSHYSDSTEGQGLVRLVLRTTALCSISRPLPCLSPPTPPPLPTTVHPAAVVQRKSRCPASAPANGNSFQLHLPPRSPPTEAPPPAASQHRGHASQPRGHASQRPRLPKLCLSKAPPPASQKPRLPAPNLEPGTGVQGRAAARGKQVLRPEPRPASRPPQRDAHPEMLPHAHQLVLMKRNKATGKNDIKDRGVIRSELASSSKQIGSK